MIFLLDMDGVICNFVDGMIATHGWPITHDEYTTYDHNRAFDVSDTDMWTPTNDGVWWTKLAPYPWAEDLVTRLAHLGDVVFCTSPNLDATCPSQKVQWLRDKGFMGQWENNYQIGKRKELNAKSGAILIDDSDANVDKYIQCGGAAIRFPQPWNENAAYKGDKVEFVMTRISAILEM